MNSRRGGARTKAGHCGGNRETSPRLHDEIAYLARLEEMIALAEQLGAHRLEIAHVQYYGWAMRIANRFCQSREQVERSLEIIRAAQSDCAGECASRLLCDIPKGVHGRMGAKAHADRSFGPRASLPRRA